MTSNQPFLENIYEAFNKREIETIISAMRPDVEWANGLEGGFIHGREAVREYWLEQFRHIQPQLEALSFETDAAGRDVVTVHQIVKDLQGNTLADATIHQIFTVDEGAICRYEISESETILDRIEAAKSGH